MESGHMMGRTMDTPVSGDRSRPGRLAIMLALYFLFLLPSLNQVSTYHSDERFYTDAAVYMVNHSDFLTPYYPDGDLRLNKPIVGYLALILSYAVLGISFFSSRLPFLLAGCATLGLTYRMAVDLTGSRKQAMLAVAVLASNIQFITQSLRATPDIVQALFLNLSLYGFYALVSKRDTRLRNYLYAYLGAALAVETKGLLGFAPVAYAFLFNTLAVKKGERVEKLVHWPVILLSVVVAVWWYVAMVVQHGGGALGHFYQDQVGDRLSGPKYYILLNIKDYIWGLFRHFLPWSFLLAAGMVLCRLRLRSWLSRHKIPAYFALGWIALLLLVFVGANTSRTRYLLPAYPLLSILTASLLAVILDEARAQVLWRWICVTAGALLAFAGGLLILGGLALHWKLFVAGTALVVAACAVFRITLKNRAALAPIVLASSLVLAIACGHALVAPVFDFEPARKLTACILQSKDIQPPVSVWLEKEHKFAGQLYTLSKGRIIGHRFPGPVDAAALGTRRMVALSQNAKASLDLTRYQITACGSVMRPMRIAQMWRIFHSGGKDAFFKAIQEPLYWIRPLPG